MPPLAALLLDWVITALWPLIGKAGKAYYSGIVFCWAGLVIGLVVLAPWLAARGRWRQLLKPKLAKPLFLMGLFSGAASAIYICALAYTTPANAAIMAQVEVIYSALLSAYFLRERLSAAQLAASGLVIAGTGLIMAHDVSSPRWRGDLMVLATPWLFQVSHIFSKRLPKGLDPWVVSGGRVVYGIVVIAPAAALSLWRGPAFARSPQALETLLLQGVLMSSLNFVLWYSAILRMDLAKATAVLLSYPALTVLFSGLLGREPIYGVQIAGLVVTLSGALWISRLVLRAQSQLPDAERLPREAAPGV